MVFKKIILPSLVLLIVGGLAFWVVNKERDSTLSVKSTNFSVEDTAAINKIKLANMSGGSVTLERSQAGSWKVNGEYKANQTKINTLLTTIKKVEVKSPVPLNSRENVIKELASRNIQVDIYKKDELVRSYFVGHQTPDEMGTYMAMNNEEKKPYITHIPGFYGYLSSRYFVDSQKWRTKKVLAYNPLKIKKVAIQYKNRPDSSFILAKKGSENFQIKNPASGQTLKNPSLNAVKKFLVRFKNIQFETALKGKDNKKYLDSLKSVDPAVLLNIRGKEKADTRVELYEAGSMPKEEKGSNASSTKRYYAIASHRPRQVLILQHMVIKPILKSFRDFDSEKIN